MNRMTKQRRLERAGYEFISGWVPREPNDATRRAKTHIKSHLEDVSAAAAEPAPLGRPAKRGAKAMTPTPRTQKEEAEFREA